ncbi:tRNA-splicing endonuclease subunit [Metarhizium acridum]|uniref:tRNA-splicing endonuclease subunit Sen34 n=1 Tax=Metarhizium acridum (strain CQMa 102) TaxID=655827 RepID=E9EHE1_METAQ|nr:tRNA-splicing endonuclease subunit, putative [Metarhizium acridum CQMa 102]EFY84658.1 tRNA-splicing endonuclease subunit, putative [Metarhizium acridum CQMa 102]KAG8417850.1 tRNA-splicing endonuclease subunit [Metarhizium acridum]KAG8428139.1 tRNA-splicing endonuclease subunit [Metarhizium acridum]
MTTGPMISTSDHSEIGPNKVRISEIAGRYLVFDPNAASLLRRQENTAGTLVGTTPQQPTQNLFLGLPVELRPEEAHTLARKGSAYIVDDVAAHGIALNSASKEARALYIDHLRQSKQTAQHVLAERAASRAAPITARQKQNKAGISCPSRMGIDSHTVASDIITYPDDNDQASTVGLLALTPVSSIFLLPRNILRPSSMPLEPAASLCGFLQERGNYMTPGLRFGAQHSVYPGDPLRFHAHFMANDYDWDEHIAILDIVGGGRLATAVKKAFLLGGQEPGRDARQSSIHTYSVEWAAM